MLQTNKANVRKILVIRSHENYSFASQYVSNDNAIIHKSSCRLPQTEMGKRHLLPVKH